MWNVDFLSLENNRASAVSRSYRTINDQFVSGCNCQFPFFVCHGGMIFPATRGAWVICTGTISHRNIFRLHGYGSAASKDFPLCLNRWCLWSSINADNLDVRITIRRYCSRIVRLLDGDCSPIKFNSTFILGKNFPIGSNGCIRICGRTYIYLGVVICINGTHGTLPGSVAVWGKTNRTAPRHCDSSLAVCVKFIHCCIGLCNSLRYALIRLGKSLSGW